MSSRATVAPYNSLIVAGTVEPDGVETSGADVPNYSIPSQDVCRVPRSVNVLTFLHVKDTVGLCTAYRVTTSSILPYSSDDERKDANRVGVL